MPEQEMFLRGWDDGSVFILCTRKGCGDYLEIDVPHDATPKDVDRIWHQHRLDHANKEK